MHRDKPIHGISEAGQGSNIFFDCSSSTSRDVESATEVTTCITPQHSIYSIALERFLQPIELLAGQGIWRDDSENKAAFDKMAANSKLSQDLAGNSFTSTVVQAMFLTAMVSSSHWVGIVAGSQTESPTPQPQPSEARIPTKSGKRKAKVALEDSKSKESEMAMVSVADSSGKSQPSSGSVQDGEDKLVEREPDDSHPSKTRFRLRGKKSPAHLFQVSTSVKQKKGKGFGGKGNRRAKGKKPMATIAQKERIFQEFEKAREHQTKAAALKSVAKLGLPGFYPGCLYQSKWGSVREEQRWTLLLQTAPALCSKHKELPNSLRRILNMEKLKFSETTTGGPVKTHLPFVFQEVVENMTMERISAGEEVSTTYIKHLILFLAEIWNETIETIGTMLQTKGLDYLKEHDEELAEMSQAEMDCVFQKMVERQEELLAPIHLTETDGALVPLGHEWGIACKFCKLVKREGHFWPNTVEYSSNI